MEAENQRILIIDDEEDLCEILQFNLEGEGFLIDIVYSAEEALKKDFTLYDLIIMDVMMGQMSGFKLASVIRKEMNLSVPIVFITAKNTENDLLTGFNLGADDFINKPFSIREVIARVKAVLKRFDSQDTKKSKSLTKGDIVLNFEKRNLKINQEKIVLTNKEFEILSLLLKSEERIYTREEIMKKVWNDNTIVTNRTIDVHITRLRKKMGNYGSCIKSEAGYGYFFEI